MMLILRCVFWLMIVYAAILTHGTFRLSELGSLSGRGSSGLAVLRPSVADPGSLGVVGTMAAGTATFCARHADECLADAKKLTALLTETGALSLRRPAEAHDDPMPSREPRHKRRDAKSAGTP